MLSLQIGLISTDLHLALNPGENNKNTKNASHSDCFLFPKTRRRITRTVSFQRALKIREPKSRFVVQSVISGGVEEHFQAPKMFPPSADNGKPYSHGTQGHSHKAPVKQLYVSSGISSIMCRKEGGRDSVLYQTPAAQRGEGARQGHGAEGEKNGGGCGGWWGLEKGVRGGKEIQEGRALRREDADHPSRAGRMKGEK